jgi:uncharacterized membrane protein YozB (DUF420 family)
LDFYLLVATSSLILQLIVLGLLLLGFNFKRKKLYRQHGFLMSAAVLIHLISILVVMVPSFGAIVFFETGLSTYIVVLSIVHGLLGLSAFILGLWLVAFWRFRQSPQKCFTKKKAMRLTIILWITAIILGAILYFILYMPLTPIAV